VATQAVFNNKVEIHVEKAESIRVNVSCKEGSAGCTGFVASDTEVCGTL
jgi:hypothetical protein